MKYFSLFDFFYITLTTLVPAFLLSLMAQYAFGYAPWSQQDKGVFG